jgi:micrococcal nuclease
MKPIPILKGQVIVIHADSANRIDSTSSHKSHFQFHLPMNKKIVTPIILGVAVAVMLAIPIAPPTTIDQLQCSEDVGECFTTEVTRVIDGDTVETLQGESIRFALASAPELSEPNGQEAKKYIESICPTGSIILVDEDDEQMSGSYGRIIAQVTCNGSSLNERLMEGQFGTIDTRYCNISEFASEPWAEKYCN